MLILKLQYFGHLILRADSFENTLMLGKTEGGRRNGVAIMVNKRVQNAVLGCNLKNDRMISVLL